MESEIIRTCKLCGVEIELQYKNDLPVSESRCNCVRTKNKAFDKAVKKLNEVINENNFSSTSKIPVTTKASK